MLKIQMALIALLIGCLTFTSCDLIQPLLTPEVPEETVPEETVPEETMPVEEMATEGTMPDYASWMSVTYAAFDPTHGQADRTVYINNVGAMALQAGMTTYPVGDYSCQDNHECPLTPLARPLSPKSREWRNRTIRCMPLRTDGYTTPEEVKPVVMVATLKPVRTANPAWTLSSPRSSSWLTWVAWLTWVMWMTRATWATWMPKVSSVYPEPKELKSQRPINA